jgi:hypothetical protein
VRGTWTKSRAHIISHVLLALVLFVICRATFPEVTIPSVDAKTLTENDWFKLAKDTGLIYAVLLVPIVAVAIYGACLRLVGRMLVAVAFLIFPPSSRRSPFRLLTNEALEPLALTLKKDDFDWTDLGNRAAELVLKYQSKKSEAWENYQSSIERLTKNAQVYLGDLLVFALFWICLFLFAPLVPWVQQNRGHFWSVVFILLALAWIAWFRVARAVAVVPSLLLIFVSTMVRTDPDMAPLLDVNLETRDRLRNKLDQLLRENKNAADFGPSLRGFVTHRLGLLRSNDNSKSSTRRKGFPFRAVYQRGSRFSWDRKQYEQYDDQWIMGYLSYLYYRFHYRVSNFVRTLGQLIRYIVTGAP